MDHLLCTVSRRTKQPQTLLFRPSHFGGILREVLLGNTSSVGEAGLTTCTHYHVLHLLPQLSPPLLPTDISASLLSSVFSEVTPSASSGSPRHGATVIFVVPKSSRAAALHSTPHCHHHTACRVMPRFLNLAPLASAAAFLPHLAFQPEPSLPTCSMIQPLYMWFLLLKTPFFYFSD